VRGVFRSSAISPTIMPGATSTTSGCVSAAAWVTWARPEPISRKDTACSPWRIRI
jgi:hypothetical protein